MSMGLRSSWRVAVAAIVLAVGFFLHQEGAPIDTLFPPRDINPSIEAHFADNYYQARAKFRAQASKVGATLHTLPLEHLTHLDLTIDVAVVDGANDSLLLHVSGTHGVEGFAGSAIQSDLLGSLTAWKQQRGPTLVFVHALNPFGFAQLRRYNEHNIDLNRNWLSPAQFKKVTSADPNQFGYVDLDGLLNPAPEESGALWFWPRAAYYLFAKGFRSIKRAAVSGNYHFPTSLFYCGNEKQPSLRILEQFLTETMHIDRVQKLGMIDVHTGLGQAGFDSLLLHHTDPSLMLRVFASDAAAGHIERDRPSSEVSSGYDSAIGYVDEGVLSLLTPDAQAKSLLFAQEFGTIPNVFALKALSQENAYYHHAPTRRLPYAERVRDAFYLHTSMSWRRSVVARGRSVFLTLYTYLSA